ncbi:hypothetical protein [Deinococcus roseus]|uniref:Uncharacterized protein n=1 Tax=Deinococcus roseus TaxID=392414 RepID=A0ABQ2D5Z0_9DEIO|nr:hypothetical protein [Deinococcus roseus]GGJ44755.1 hypothetical protein GCM10008938_33700 [Deinococcus roseus]
MHVVVSFTSLNPGFSNEIKHILLVLKAQQCPEHLEKRVLEEVLTGVSEQHQSTLKQRMLMLLDFGKVTGIATLNGDMSRMEIRLQASELQVLKTVCSRVVSCLLEADQRRTLPLGITVEGRMVLAGEDGQPVLTGRVSRHNSWSLAFMEEDRNASIFRWGLTLVVVLQCITFPAFAHRLFSRLDADTYLWVQNFLRVGNDSRENL